MMYKTVVINKRYKAFPTHKYGNPGLKGRNVKGGLSVLPL